ncbi:D-glycero-alpha-D-manno-heptose-1,7-bisphosphate 7-phosphatase [Anaeroselena agilis]|uniref:D,D-heptose 1,7-bisphosphate phosphatase n=1 Tax=Anaeroselena agilis TaxID=3063788 RepID=A0ABU3P459_9FIRM|nr:HAD family hydrolase [Selenomonadales bacterium 4137-cl]
MKGGKAGRPAAFFDRDGVLNVDKGYLYRSEEFEWIPGAVETIKRLNDQGFLVFVVTNQSGVARGYYREEDVVRLHAWMNGELANHGARIDKFYYCPHYTEGPAREYVKACQCRKPLPGLILAAFAEWDIDREKSFLIGDKDSDLAAAEAAGIRGYKFAAGNLAAFLKTANVIRE